jgi:hypothetical protein
MGGGPLGDGRVGQEPTAYSRWVASYTGVTAWIIKSAAGGTGCSHVIDGTVMESVNQRHAILVMPPIVLPPCDGLSLEGLSGNV